MGRRKGEDREEGRRKGEDREERATGGMERTKDDKKTYDNC